MNLREQQALFSKLLGLLIQYAYQEGYELSFGETWRSDEQAEINALGQIKRERVAALIEAEFPLLAEKIRNNGKNNGIRASLHCDRLAADFNLFRDGKLLDGAAHKVLGDYWESLNSLCTWGGRFGDPPHYSMIWNGKK